MKDILFIGGPEKVQGVERIKDDVHSILAVDGLYDRKAVVVWPTDEFLSLPEDSSGLASVADMNQVEIRAMTERGMIPPEGITADKADERRLVVREDHEAMDEALVSSSLNQAFNKLSKLILSVAGGQNLVVVLSEDMPSHYMSWTEITSKWTKGDGKIVKNYKSDSSAYGTLNSVKDWPLVFHDVQPGPVRVGSLVPSNKGSVCRTPRQTERGGRGKGLLAV
jgi:hypothetical protein